jgi:glycosyltransferase involved in cell wall biosynthesis
MVNVSVILPCLNEEEGIGESIKKIQRVFNNNNIDGEIIVSDNGSTDNSASIAKQFDIKYVFEPRRGYGNAYMAGLNIAKGNYFIMGDPDGSYDFNEIPRFLHHLQNHEIVIGSRFKGNMKKGAMPSLHKYIGNPGIKLLLWGFYGIKNSEPSTGFVGLRRESLGRLKLNQPGMEFAIEFLIKAKKYNLDLKEIPITYYTRLGESKLRTFRDGFRYFVFMVRERFRK